MATPTIYFTERQFHMNDAHIDRYMRVDGLTREQAEIRLLKGQVKTLQVALAIRAVQQHCACNGTQHIEGDNDCNDGKGIRMLCPVCAGDLTYKVKADGGINGVCLTPKCVCFGISGGVVQ